MFNNILGEELIDEIGKYLGFVMWNKRDKSKEYDFPNAKEENSLSGDIFVEGNIIIYNNTPLLVYKKKNGFHNFNSLYTLNLFTIKPTKNSKTQTIISQELVEKIKIKKAFEM